MIMSSSFLINCKIINTMAERGIKLDFKSNNSNNMLLSCPLVMTGTSIRKMNLCHANLYIYNMATFTLAKTEYFCIYYVGLVKFYQARSFI